MTSLLIPFVWFVTQEVTPVHYSHAHMPAHGTVFCGKLFGFFAKEKADFKLYSVAVSRPIIEDSVTFLPHIMSGPPGHNFRHHIRYNCVWFATFVTVYRLNFAELDLYRAKNVDAFFEKYPDSNPHEMFQQSLFRKYSRIAQREGINNFLATDVAGFGSVPMAAQSDKSYILGKSSSNFEVWESHFDWSEKPFGIQGLKGWTARPSMRFKKLDQWIADLDNNSFEKRVQASDELEKLGELAEPALKKLLAAKASLEASRRAQRLLDKINNREGKSEGLWEDGENYEKFSSLFAEDFYFFLRKNDYYFVTESGKLFYAPPPKDGAKSRTMKPLWDDVKRPIVAVIEDADRDKVWLFAKDRNPGAKLDHFFEMKESIRAESFDPTKLRPVNVEGRAKLLLEYLPLIAADGKK